MSSGLASGPAGTANGAVGSLVTTGNSVLPTSTVNNALQPATAKLPASVTLANNSLGGSPTQPVGVSVLSNTPSSGSLASVNALSAGQTAAVSVTPGSGLSTLPLTSNVAGQTLTGGSGTQPIAVNALSPTNTTGSVATVGALSGGNAATATVTPSLVSSPLGSSAGGNLATTGNSVLTGTSSLANATAANQPAPTGSSPLVGASALSGSQNSGSLVTAGALANNQTATASVGKRQILKTN